MGKIFRETRDNIKENHNINIAFILDLNIIIGIDFLERYRAIINYYTKEVTSKLPTIVVVGL